MEQELNLNNVPKIRIPIHEVKLGMIIAEDIYNPAGLLLIPNKTKIIEAHLISFRLYQIYSIRVYDLPEVEDEQPNNTPEIPANKRFDITSESFLEFEAEYNKRNILAKQYISHISMGSDIHINDLFNLSNNLIDNLTSSSDLFSYIYNLKHFDDYTYTHCLNVSMLCNIFGRWLKMSENDLKILTVAGLLHDVGKTTINNDILNKKGKLSDSEFELVKQHTLKGYEIIKNNSLPEEVKLAVLQHHEKFDGSGYPYGLTNDSLSDFSKIVAITDIYDAMTSDRVYHKRLCPFKVIRIFENEGFNALDTSYLFVFLENIAQNFIGSYVLLSNDEIGKIVFINKNTPSKPFVEVGDKIYNLLQETSIDILEIL